jgi:hypothetical protein
LCSDQNRFNCWEIVVIEIGLVVDGLWWLIVMITIGLVVGGLRQLNIVLIATMFIVTKWHKFRSPYTLT